MSGLSVETLFNQAFEQAGYAITGLKTGARNQLISYTEELASRHGMGETFNSAKSYLSNNLGIDLENQNSNNENLCPVQKCMKESGAAAMSAIISGAANSIGYIAEVRNGKMNAKEAFVKIVGETVTSAADSAIKAAGDAGRQIIIEKYGSEENALKTLAGQGMAILGEKVPMLAGNSQIMDKINQLLEFAKSKNGDDKLSMNALGIGDSISRQQDGIVKNAANGVMNIFKFKFPASFKMLPIHPVFLAASMVVMIAGKIAVKNGIEKPFQDLTRNTTTLKDTISELERVSHSMCNGQLLFGKFLESDAQMETALKNQMTRIDQARNSARDAILKI